MSTESAMHKRNLESSILFMQQEHAATLKGLHDEIAVLQKRCTDLTFQLTMHGLTIDEPGTIDNKMQEVQHELEASRERISTLEKEVADRDKRVERLEAEARTQRKRWLDESRAQSQTLNSLRAELEAKANNIAYLTTELHRLKQKNRGEETGGENSGSQNAKVLSKPAVPGQAPYLHQDSTHAAKKSHTHHHYIPAPPPREKTLGPSSASSRLRRSGHSKSVTGSVSGGKPVLAIHPASADAIVGRQPNPLRLSSGRSSGSESPDITPFLPQPKEEVVPVVGAKQAPILPPIPVSSSTSLNTSGAPHPLLVHQVVSATSQHRQMKANPSKAGAAIVTLAVENAAAPESAWAFAQESRSSEYN